jgi:hypothetical protein
MGLPIPKIKNFIQFTNDILDASLGSVLLVMSMVTEPIGRNGSQ